MKLENLALGVVIALSLAAACSANDGGAGSGGSSGSAATAGASGAGSGGVGGIADGGPDGFNPAETVVVIGPGAPQDAPTKFGGAEDPSAGPELVYPADGILVPPNMKSLELHFKPAANQTLFEIRFSSAAVELVVYVGCTQVGAGCVYQTDATFWDKLVEKNRGTPPVGYRVRGVNGNAPGAVGVSSSRTLAFAVDDIVGGLYYWNTSGVIQRYEFGAPVQAAELYMSAPMAGALTCVGCHSLARDGKKMAIGQDIPAPAPYKVYDVATRTPLPGQSGPVGGTANFFSFSPDGGLLLYSDGIKIGVLDTTTGVIVDDTLIPTGTMPDWAPNGKQIVYARPSTPPPLGFPNPGVASGSIEIVSYDNGTVSAPQYLAQFQGQNNYYPAFAPSQEWVVFNRSPKNAESFSNAPPAGDGELWAVSTAGAQQIRLDAANDGGGCSWPKWAPDVGTYHGGTVMWLTFSSGRGYGLRLAPGTQTQLWMTAFDPARAAKGQDPSFPGFWFPYQDIAGGNYIAQWVTEVARKPCTNDDECEDGEECKDGKCFPVIK